MASGTIGIGPELIFHHSYVITSIFKTSISLALMVVVFLGWTD
jgi:hypothetical protein